MSQTRPAPPKSALLPKFTLMPETAASEIMSRIREAHELLAIAEKNLNEKDYGGCMERMKDAADHLATVECVAPYLPMPMPKNSAK